MPDLAQPFNALIAQNTAPPANPLAQTVQQVAGAEGAQAQADSAQLANAQQHLQFITDGLTPLIAKGANITPADVANAGADVVATSRGRISPSEITSFLGQLPSDGAGIQAFLQRHLMRVQDANSRLATMRGAPIETQTGGGTQFGTRNAFTNRYQAQGSSGYVPNQPGVGLTEGPSRMTPTGPVKTVVTQQQAYDLSTGKASVDSQGRIVYTQPSGGGYQPPGGSAPPAPALPASSPPALPQNRTNPPASGEVVPVGPAPNDPQGRIPSPATPMAVGAPSGAAGAADVASQGSAGQGLALQKAADQVPNAQATIYNMQNELDKFTSGPYADKLNRLKSGVNQVGEMVGAGDAFDPKTVAAQQEFHKNAEMLAQSAFAALGGTGTDSQLASAHGSNPNDSLSGLGNKQILPMLLGLQDAVAAKNAAWQQYRQQHGDGSYGQFSSDFNQNFSPRAFQFVRMSPEQRQDLIKSMNPTEQKALGSALLNAEQRGWIKPSGQ